MSAKKTKLNTELIKHPLSTEKSIRLMEAENKLIFVVDRRATKPEIKAAIEELFKVKIISVSTFITPKGEKRAYVRFSDETPAIDIATQMGLM
ncbi:MAG: 50S ribosomal protein L23 [Candidatus Woesearchaeota archaeon]